MSNLDSAARRGIDVVELLDRIRGRAENVDAFTAAYRRYYWPIEGLSGVRLAPFQLLAAEVSTYRERPYADHLQLADRLVEADPELIATTRRIVVDAGDAESVQAGISWWEELTAAGGESMVVKPASNLTRGARVGAAWAEGAVPGVSADHLRARMHRRRTSNGSAAASCGTNDHSRCAGTRSGWRR